MNVTIATLTCNDRECLFNTVDYVLENTDLTGVDWTIFAQGCSEEFLTRLEKKFEGSKVQLRLTKNTENLGCSQGFNRLWDLLQDYDFGLMLEDDWLLEPQERKDWLQVLVLLFKEQPTVDIVFLRKYISDEEKHQYGWTRHIPYRCFQGRQHFNYANSMKTTIPFKYRDFTFQRIQDFMYTNNPTFFRVEAYKKIWVFPFTEVNDKHDTRRQWNDSSALSPLWGGAEAEAMEKTRFLRVLYMEQGLFTHFQG